ncbi:MAG: DotD/TraH family lipoprotein [Rhodospirillales bacterium]|nr:DotD/TraH family lipoprotein [Rhodospirillales bacterium]
MIRYMQLLSLVSAVVFVTACTPWKKVEPPQLVASPDKVSMMLAEAADRTSVALETLAAVEQARSPGISAPPAEDVPVELRRAITVNWVGPVEPISKTLSDRAGYTFQVLGNPPPVAVIVSVDVENKPIIDVLRSIGLQLGMRADVRVDASRKTVELHYAPNTGVGG